MPSASVCRPVQRGGSPALWDGSLSLRPSVRRWWAEASHGQVVAGVGEAGVGSRAWSMSSSSHYTQGWRGAASVSYGKATPYFL